MTERELIQNVLKNPKLAEFVRSNLEQSLGDLNLSSSAINDLFPALETFDIKGFGAKHWDELYQKHTVGFLENAAGKFFKNEIIPFIKASETILDVGCGTGTLVNLLAGIDKFKRIIGIDINTYPQWEDNKNPKVQYSEVEEAEFIKFLSDTKPESIVMTWTLHHMAFDQQERYMKYVFDVISSGSQIVILEDSYAETLQPIYGGRLNKSFMVWSKEDRYKIMGINDWVANRILAQRKKIPMPFGYRTVEEWEQLFTKIGYTVKIKKYFGFPANRDVNNPQSLLVIEK
jgi:ubiquinone/menaquinone biosynthesis C-methylase UbiE